MTENILTVDQVKDVLSCSRSMVYKLIETGQLKAFTLSKTGKGLRVHHADMDRFIRERATDGLDG